MGYTAASMAWLSSGVPAAWRNAPVLERHGRFHIVRDDLIPGGTKTRALCELLAGSDSARVAYACDKFGHGPLALAHAAAAWGMEAILIFPAMPKPTPSVLAVRDMAHVKIIICEEAVSQNDAYALAGEIAAAHNARLFPIGFDTPEFVAALSRIAGQIGIVPEQAWSLAGSGCLTRALQSVWPAADIHAVSMGFPHARTGRAIVHTPLEAACEEAKIRPPYPSAPYYDAKVWHVAQSFGRDGALIWNVA